MWLASRHIRRQRCVRGRAYGRCPSHRRGDRCWCRGRCRGCDLSDTACGRTKEAFRDGGRRLHPGVVRMEVFGLYIWNLQEWLAPLESIMELVVNYRMQLAILYATQEIMRAPNGTCSSGEAAAIWVERWTSLGRLPVLVAVPMTVCDGSLIQLDTWINLVCISSKIPGHGLRLRNTNLIYYISITSATNTRQGLSKT